MDIERNVKIVESKLSDLSENDENWYIMADSLMDFAQVEKIYDMAAFDRSLIESVKEVKSEKFVNKRDEKWQILAENEGSCIILANSRENVRRC